MTNEIRISKFEKIETSVSGRLSSYGVATR